MILTTKSKYQEVLPMGNSITQKLKYKQSVIKFSFKYGITKATIRFGENRRTIYRWIERYDGTLESLKDKSRRPHSHPNEHTEEEIKMIKNYKANNKETGLVVLWIKLRNVGQKRNKFVQKDEYSRYRYIWFTNAHDTYASTEFLEKVIKV